MVSGHVDGLGEVESRYNDGRSTRFRIKAPDDLAKYIAAKGSITIDGVSLTVNVVDGAFFEINIVPHTIQETIQLNEIPESASIIFRLWGTARQAAYKIPNPKINPGPAISHSIRSPRLICIPASNKTPPAAPHNIPTFIEFPEARKVGSSRNFRSSGVTMGGGA